MIFAETMTGCRITKTFEWSPLLKAAVQTIRYWKFHLRLLRGACITDTSVQKLHQEAFQSPYEPDDLSHFQIILNIKDSYKNLKYLQKLHRQLW
jgi:3-dehydroquinate synthetase